VPGPVSPRGQLKALRARGPLGVGEVVGLWVRMGRWVVVDLCRVAPGFPGLPRPPGHAVTRRSRMCNERFVGPGPWAAGAGRAPAAALKGGGGGGGAVAAGAVAWRVRERRGVMNGGCGGRGGGGAPSAPAEAVEGG